MRRDDECVADLIQCFDAASETVKTSQVNHAVLELKKDSLRIELMFFVVIARRA